MARAIRRDGHERAYRRDTRRTGNTWCASARVIARRRVDRNLGAARVRDVGRRCAMKTTADPGLRTGAQILCEALVRQGVDVMFGIPGGAIMPFYHALPE